MAARRLVHRNVEQLKRAALASMLALVGSSCSRVDEEPKRSSEATVHTYSAPPLDADASVNAYFVETAHGVVVIDGLRTLHEGREALAELRKIGKPVLAVMLSHPHPDHIGGLGVLLNAGAAGTPLYGSNATKNELVADTHGYFELLASTMAGDFPAKPEVPTHIVSDGQRVSVDGVEFAFFELGAGESVSSTVIVMPSKKLAFVGDLTSNRMTPYLVEGLSGAWLSQLETLGEVLDGVELVYPGHGRDYRTADAIEQQRSYLHAFRELVDQYRTPQGLVEADGRSAIIAEMNLEFANFPPVAELPDLLSKNIDAVAKELAAQQ